MNEQNLIPNSERTPSERQEIARKGGIASGEARREKKLAKQIAIDILNEQTTTTKDGRKLTLKEAMVEGLIKKTIKNPKSKEVDFVLALIGEEVERKQTHIIERGVSDEDVKYFSENFGFTPCDNNEGSE
jgi:hypothetical protein